MEMELHYKTRAPFATFPERLDPAHEMDWKSLIDIEWTAISAVEYSYGFSADGSIVPEKNRVFVPIRHAKRVTHCAQSIKVVAALHEWNTLTSYQLSALIGEDAWKFCRALYESGVLLRAHPAWWESSNDDSGVGMLWRLNRDSWTLTEWERALTHLEWMVGMNQIDIHHIPRGANSPSSMRHNLLGAEIALKAMECIPQIIGAFGELHCSGDDFIFTEIDETKDNLLETVGDFSLITKSGRVLVFELAAGGSVKNKMASISAKASRWAQILMHTSLPIDVVFLDGSNGGQTQKDALESAVNYGLTEMLPKIVSNSSKIEKAAKHVHIASTSEWMPLARSVSTEFLTLASVPALSKSINSPLLSESDDHANIESDVVRNVLAALSTPSWIASTPESMNE